MRLGWSIRLPGPFRLSGTIWRSGRRRRHRRRHRVYAGQLPGWKCRHKHRTQEAALECARRESRKRKASP
jgi:hypothetical protein